MRTVLALARTPLIRFGRNHAPMSRPGYGPAAQASGFSSSSSSPLSFGGNLPAGVLSAYELPAKYRRLPLSDAEALYVDLGCAIDPPAPPAKAKGDAPKKK